MIEGHFIPVVIYNNVRGKDAALLKEFKEPSWNYQVVRFLSAEKKDVIPRKDQVNSVSGIAGRMIEALKATKRPVPDQLRELAK